MKSDCRSLASMRIRQAMTAQGISSAAELARRVGLPRQTVHRWLNDGVRTITPEHLFHLADVLRIDARWLALGEAVPLTGPSACSASS